MGKRFGFVRFSGITHPSHLFNQLCDTWFGYHKLLASFHFPSTNFGPAPQNPVPLEVEKQNTPSNSYANVVHGTPMVDQLNNSPDEVIDIVSRDFVLKKKEVCMSF